MAEVIVNGTSTTGTSTTTTTGTQPTQQAVQTPPAAAQQVAAQPQFDYDKLASIIEGKQTATEDTVLKGYFKEQGLTGEEMKSAIEMFKKDKASRTPDVNALNQQIKDANARAVMAETKVEAMNMAAELGVEQKTIPYLLKMADLSNVITDGQIDQEKLKESLTSVLADVPQLKVGVEETPHGFKVGADTSKQTDTSTQDELAKIFGLKKG